MGEAVLIDDIIVRRPLGPPPLALRLAAVLAVPVVLYALVATGQKALDNYRLNQETETLRAEVVALRTDNIALQKQIELARGDAAIEAIARTQLGLVKPGDHPIVVASDPPSAVAPERQPPPAAPAVEALPPWRQWFNLFFG
jgi:cell division protein FtsB